EGGEDLAARQRGKLSMAKTIGAADATRRDFDHAAMDKGLPVGRTEADLAGGAQNAGAVAAVIGDAERSQRSQGVVVGPVVAGAKSDGRGRPCGDQRLGCIVDQRALLVEGEVLDVGARAPW